MKVKKFLFEVIIKIMKKLIIKVILKYNFMYI